ncbi:MAG: DNA/RNA nuclease SfsA [Thermodesulfobacteriota bacterium]
MENPTAKARLNWPQLRAGTLVQRYKRFLADVKLRNRHLVTAHCPNSGSMKTCSEPGRTVYLSRSNNPRRRLRYTWEMIAMPGSLVGTNTNVPNRLVREAIVQDVIPALAGYESVRAEVPYGVNSRIDLLLTSKSADRCYVEVKNCTLVEDRVAYFPDAVTARGLKHLVELQNMVRQGHRAAIFFLIQRMDADTFRPADHIDPAYGKELRRAVRNGVTVLAYDVTLDLHCISLNRRIPYEL